MALERRRVWLTAFMLMATAGPAPALELSVSGYYRSRFDLFDSLDAHKGGVPPVNVVGTNAYWQQRWRVEPRLQFTDAVSFHSQIDLLDNVVAGSRPEEGSFLTAAGPVAQPILSESAEKESLRLNRAWLRYRTGSVQLDLGRMGAHWGLGVLDNDGNCLDCDFGDTRDRIQAAFNLAPFHIVPFYERIAEQSLDLALNGGILSGSGSNANDVDRYGFQLLLSDERRAFGAYAFNLRHSASETSLYGFDVFWRTQWERLELALEGVRVMGKITPDGLGTGKRSADQYGLALQARAPLGRWTWQADAGLASGDDNLAGGHLSQFAFDRNYRVALILFREFLGVTPAGSALIPNAVSNAVYGRINAEYALTSRFSLTANVASAEAMDRINGGWFYGLETDGGVIWIVNELIKCSLQAGYLFAGDVFDLPGAEADDVFTAQGRVFLIY